MTSSKKKPEMKAKQEPPVEQPSQAGVPEDPAGVPMAAPPPAKEDRLAALELANIELEKRVAQLERNCKASHGMR